MTQLTEKQEELFRQGQWDFSDLRALFINCTLKRSPEVSNTQGLTDISIVILRRQGVKVDAIRAIDHDNRHGCVAGHDRTRFGKRRMARDLRAGASSTHPRAVHTYLARREVPVCTQVIERLYGNSHLLK